MKQTKPLTPMVLKVLKIIDQPGGRPWTSTMITGRIKHDLNQLHNAPKAPKEQQIRSYLRTLTDLALITRKHHQEGKVGYFTYAPVIPEPLIKYVHKPRTFRFWSSLIIASSLWGFFGGVMT